MTEFFILLAYIVGTVFGWWIGRSSGMRQGIADTVDNLIEQGFLKWKGSKANPEIKKWNED
tara:strand:- start:371 stop:553 length:183 start_codon:yes stop_codon:yes gene_type:complete